MTSQLNINSLSHNHFLATYISHIYESLYIRLKEVSFDFLFMNKPREDEDDEQA